MQPAVGQLGRRTGAEQRHRAPPPLLAFLAGGLAGEARAGGFGRALDHHPAGAPAAAAFAPAAWGRGEGEGGPALGRAAEMRLGALRDRPPVQLGDALAAVGPAPAVDGDGEAPGPDQLRHRGRAPAAAPRQRRRVVSRVAAHRPVGGRVGDEQPDRAVALDLDGEHAAVLERRGEQPGQGRELAEQRRHRGRVVPAGDDAVHRRAQPHQPAARRPGLEAERQHHVAGHRRAVYSKQRSRIAFCACIRFSASSQTADCGPSITESVTSSPRCAGRQCRKTASGLARAISRSSTR